MKGLSELQETPQTIYDLAGGADTIRRLVDHFYGYVAADPDLKPIFPEDFTEIREKQYCFLSQFFGGPMLYSQRYGQPMMRARHMPHAVTPTRARAWLQCMERAMDDAGIQGDLRTLMFNRLALTAGHMVNTPDDGADGSAPTTGPAKGNGLLHIENTNQE